MHASGPCFGDDLQIKSDKAELFGRGARRFAGNASKPGTKVTALREQLRRD